MTILFFRKLIQKKHKFYFLKIQYILKDSFQRTNTNETDSKSKPSSLKRNSTKKVMKSKSNGSLREIFNSAEIFIVTHKRTTIKTFSFITAQVKFKIKSLKFFRLIFNFQNCKCLDNLNEPRLSHA